MWGHPAACSCTLCTSLERLHRVVSLARATPRFVEYSTVRIRNLIGELSDFLEAHPEEREDLARPPPQVGGKGAGREDQGGSQAAAGQGVSTETKAPQEPAGEKASGAADTVPGSAGDHHPGGIAVKREEDEEDSTEQQGKNSAAETKAPRKEANEPEPPQEEVEVGTEPEASGEGEEERKGDLGVREVVPESPHRRRRRKRRSEASRTRSPKVRRRGESSHHRRRRAASGSRKKEVKPSHAPEGREERREVSRPRSPSNPPPGFTGQTILVPARPVYRGPPDSPEYRPYEGAKNKGKKKVETQRGALVEEGWMPPRPLRRPAAEGEVETRRRSRRR